MISTPPIAAGSEAQKISSEKSPEAVVDVAGAEEDEEDGNGTAPLEGG